MEGIFQILFLLLNYRQKPPKHSTLKKVGFMQAIRVRHCADQHAFYFNVSILDSGEVVTFCGYWKFSVPPPTFLTLAVFRLF